MKSLLFPKENIKIIKYKILLFFVISLVLKLNVFAQYTMPNITVEWRRNDWVQQNPLIPNSPGSLQEGKLLETGKFNSALNTINLLQYNNGIYFLKTNFSNKQTRISKIIVSK